MSADQLRTAAERLRALAEGMTSARQSGRPELVKAARRRLLDYGYLSDAVAEKVAQGMEAEVRKINLRGMTPDEGLVALAEYINRRTHG